MLCDQLLLFPTKPKPHYLFTLRRYYGAPGYFALFDYLECLE